MERLNRSAAVDQFMQELDHPLKAEIETVRGIILDADTQITEHIKWNAPSFCYQGEDRVTFRLFPATDRIQLVFHRGAKVKEQQTNTFQDDTGLLQWITGDRATVTFRDIEEVAASSQALERLVGRWIGFTPSE